MKLLVNFKRELKEIQKIRKKTIQSTKNEFLKLEELYKKFYLSFPTRDLSIKDLQKEFPTFYNWFPRFEELIKCYEKKKVRVNKIAILYEMVKNVIQEFKSEINKFQMIIDACDDDKIKAPINNFDYLISSLELAGLNDEDTCRIFGMFCNYSANYVKKHPDYKLNCAYSIIFLGLNIFDKDGNFLNDKNSLLSYALSNVFGNIISSSNGELRDSYLIMYKSIIELSKNVFSKTNHYNVFKEKDENVGQEKIILKDNISREYLDELKKYYKNAELIKVPKDIEQFTKLLDRCEIDENEKRYILRLVSNAKIEDIEPNIWKYLNEFDRNMYRRAYEILSELHYTNPDFDLLLGIIEEIKYIGELLDELSKEEMEYSEYKVEETLINAQLDEVLDTLKNILCKYGNDKTSENKILFLLDDDKVPYLKRDSELLDSSFYKMICNGIRKIRKDNQSNFRLILSPNNTSYRVYDIISSKVHIFFVEIDSGIYVILGTSGLNNGYEDMIKRSIDFENKIKDLELLVKNEDSRNSILTSHEQYYYLFNRDEEEMSLKRKNK